MECAVTNITLNNLQKLAGAFGEYPSTLPAAQFGEQMFKSDYPPHRHVTQTLRHEFDARLGAATRHIRCLFQHRRISRWTSNKKRAELPAGIEYSKVARESSTTKARPTPIRLWPTAGRHSILSSAYSPLGRHETPQASQCRNSSSAKR